MKINRPVAAAICLALSTFASAQVQVSASPQWWSYLADYEGAPGSTRVDMGQFAKSPMRGLPYVVIAGTKYESSYPDGLPTPAELDRLNRMSDKLIAAVLEVGPAIYVGTFTQNKEQVHYIYVSSLDGVEAAFTRALATECPRCEKSYRTKHDPEWNTFLKFLYPNQQTLDFYHFDPKMMRTHDQ